LPPRKESKSGLVLLFCIVQKSNQKRRKRETFNCFPFGTPSNDLLFAKVSKTKDMFKKGAKETFKIFRKGCGRTKMAVLSKDKYKPHGGFRVEEEQWSEA